MLDYVSKFRERLHNGCSIAKESLTAAQENMKCRFDRKSVRRCFKEGDQVLVLPYGGFGLIGTIFRPLRGAE